MEECGKNEAAREGQAASTYLAVQISEVVSGSISWSLQRYGRTVLAFASTASVW